MQVHHRVLLVEALPAEASPWLHWLHHGAALAVPVPATFTHVRRGSVATGPRAPGPREVLGRAIHLPRFPPWLLQQRILQLVKAVRGLSRPQRRKEARTRVCQQGLRVLEVGGGRARRNCFRSQDVQRAQLVVATRRRRGQLPGPRILQRHGGETSRREAPLRPAPLWAGQERNERVA